MTMTEAEYRERNRQECKRYRERKKGGPLNVPVHCAWLPCSAPIGADATWCSRKCRDLTLFTIGQWIAQGAPRSAPPAHRGREQHQPAKPVAQHV